MPEFSKPIIVVAGPTAIGKSQYAIALAHRFSGSEIISADAFQVYRGLDIGTGKLRSSEWDGIVHHLIDIKSWSESYSVAEFLGYAEAIFEKQRLLGRKTIVCGGTGYYLHSLLYGAKFTTQDINEALRGELLAYADNHGRDALWKRLEALDPVYAARVHPHNVRRVCRALEVIQDSDTRISDQHVLAPEPRSDMDVIILNDDRLRVYDRINSRIDVMFESGWIDEVARLVAEGFSDTCLAYSALGYSDIQEYLLGGIGKDTMIELVKMKTRRFSKRQLTWFRRFSHAKWL